MEINSLFCNSNWTMVSDQPRDQQWTTQEMEIKFASLSIVEIANRQYSYTWEIKDPSTLYQLPRSFSTTNYLFVNFVKPRDRLRYWSNENWLSESLKSHSVVMLEDGTWVQAVRNITMAKNVSKWTYQFDINSKCIKTGINLNISCFNLTPTLRTE